MCWASTTNRNHPHNQKIFLIHYKKSRSAVKKGKGQNGKSEKMLSCLEYTYILSKFLNLNMFLKY